jgi:hypothetical protein
MTRILLTEVTCIVHYSPFIPQKISLLPEPASKQVAELLAYFGIGKLLIRFSSLRSTNLTNCSIVYCTPIRQLVVWYLKAGNDCFILCSSKFIIHSHPPVRLYVKYAVENRKIKFRNKILM